MKKPVEIAVFIPLFFAVGSLIAQSPYVIEDDLIVEGTTELQDDTEIKGDLRVTGGQGDMLIGADGLVAFESSWFSGKVGLFFDPVQMAFRAGRGEGTAWDVPWALYSTAIGHNVKATGTHSVALNQATTASGGSSLAAGKFAFSGGDVSMSMGFGTQSQAFASAVFGSYNELIGGTHDSWVSSDPVFIIGNGTAWNDRSNAVTVLKNGNVGIGISSPSYRLSVDGDVALGNTIVYGTLDLAGQLIVDGALVGGSHVEGIVIGDDLVVAGDVSWSGELTDGSVPWSRVTDAPSSFPSSVGDVAGLESALNGKFDAAGGEIAGDTIVSGTLEVTSVVRTSAPAGDISMGQFTAVPQ